MRRIKTIMKWIAQLVTLSLLAVCTNAAELIPKVTVDGKVYHDVRWGPVNQGKVVMFHNRGNVTVPLSSLPKEYQELFGYQPPPTPEPSVTPPVTPPPPSPTPAEPPKVVSPPPPPMATPRDGDWQTYSQDRKTKLVLNDKLVNRSDLSTLVGFIGSPVRVYTDSTKLRGILLELAEQKSDLAQPADELALRPNLWQRTGKMVFLRNYKADVELGVLVRLFVAPAEDLDGHDTYEVGTEASFEQWKLLRHSTLRTP